MRLNLSSERSHRRDAFAIWAATLYLSILSRASDLSLIYTCFHFAELFMLVLEQRRACGAAKSVLLFLGSPGGRAVTPASCAEVGAFTEVGGSETLPHTAVTHG